MESMGGHESDDVLAAASFAPDDDFDDVDDVDDGADTREAYPEVAQSEPASGPSAGTTVVPGGPAGLIPALVRRVDQVGGAVDILLTRLNALDDSIAGLRVLVDDRLAGYADATGEVTRSQAKTLEEYRHTSERVVAELRRTIGETDDVSRQTAARVDEVLADVQGSAADALDAIGRLEQVAADLGSRPAPDAGPVEVQVDIEPLLADFSQDIGAALEAVRGRLDRLDQTVTESWGSLLAAGPDRRADRALAAEIAALRTEVTQLKRRVGVRARSAGGLEPEQLTAIADLVADRLGQISLDDQDLERIVALIVDRLEASIEVVPDASGPARG